MNPKRRVRNFLLDKRFQLKYTLAVVLVSSVISAGLGYFLYQAHRESSKVASLDDPDLDGAMAAELAAEDRKVLIYLGIFLGGLVFCLGTIGIVATHKIAGPAYSMKRTLSVIADGKIPIVRELRKGDELKEVGIELKRMTDELRLREETDIKNLKNLGVLLADVAPEEAKTQISAMISEKEQRIEED